MRYLVFGGKTYYPCGGVDDLQGKFDDQHAARALCDQLQTTDEWGYVVCDWVHIYDVQTGETIYGS